MNMKINNFRLDLSTSKDTVKSKEEGKFKTQFQLSENISLNENNLKNIFTNYNQSTNIWSPSISKKENYNYTTGLMLDIDNTDTSKQITIREISKLFKGYHYIIFPSTNHLQQLDENKIPIEKFRVILPFSPDQYKQFESIKSHKRLYDSVIKQMPWIDSACTNPSRKFYPFCGDDDHWFININYGQGYYKPELLPKKYNFKIFKKVPQLSMDMELKIESGAIETLAGVAEIINQNNREKMSVFCPMCDQNQRKSPDSHNAAVFIDNEKIPFLFCSSCKSRGKGEYKSGNFYLDHNEKYTIQSKILNRVVFRDIISDQYFLGDKSKISGEYNINKISKQNISNALKNRKMAIPDIIDEVEYFHDFSKDTVIDVENGFVNRYIPTNYMLINPKKGKKTKIPETIEKLMRHICGNSDEIFTSLVHNLAYCIQNRKKLIIAYLFQGTQGTGKGLWFNRVIAPIFGRNYCTETLHRVFLKEFNSMLESNIWILVDEIEANFNDKGNELVRVLKQAIADIHIAIEEKGKDIRNGRNNAGFFFATNKRNGIMLEEGDRRFNIGDWQEQKINQTNWWPGDTKIKECLSLEIKQFTIFLKTLQINYSLINKIVKNKARKAIIDISMTDSAIFFKAFKERNWDWMRENISNNGEFSFSSKSSLCIINNLPTADRISRDELYRLYNCITGISKSSTGFTQLCKRNGIEVKKMTINNKSIQGISIQ